MKKNIKIYLLIFVAIICAIGFSACEKENETPIIPPEGNEETLYPVYCAYFLTGDGSETESATSDPHSGKISKPEDPVRDGYTFKYWYQKDDQEKEFDFDNVLTEDITLYALWEKDVVTIVFDGNGNTEGEMNSLIWGTGELGTLPSNNYEKTGYSFVGWSEKKDGSANYSEKGYYVPEGESGAVIRLYAVWKANSYTVRFDFCGGNSDCAEEKVTYGEFLTENLSVPYRDGYDFTGYFEMPDGEGHMYYDAEMNPVRQYATEGDSTLYACWVPKNINLMFNGNGNTSGVVNNIKCLVGETVKLPDCAYTREGYSFKEWNTEQNGSGKVFMPQDELRAGNENIELFAIWLPNRYQIEFINGNEATLFFDLVYDLPQALPINPFSKKGCTLTGWSYNENSETTEFANGATVVNLSSESGAICRLYAVWEKNKYTISLDKQGGIGGSDSVDVVFDSAIQNIIVPKKIGYYFGGYFSEIDGNGIKYLDSSGCGTRHWTQDKSDVLYAHWIPKRNSISYDGNGSTSGVTDDTLGDTGETVSLSMCGYEKTGYEFVEWNTKIDGSGISYGEKADYVIAFSETPIILYAIWQPKDVTIFFDGNGSDEAKTILLSGKSDGEILMPDNPYLRTGYEFIGWSAYKNNVNDLLQVGDFYYIKPSDVPITLYAQWRLIDYSVVYDLQGGTNDYRNPRNYTFESDTITLFDPIKPGYEFAGWNEGNIIEKGSIGNKNFTASWRIIEYRIFYVLNGGKNNSNNPVTYNIEDEDIVLENPTKTGASFLGWNEGNRIPKGSIGDKTFTAQWSGLQYNIEYKLDGGINGAGNPSSYTVDSDTIVLSDPYKPGYKFTGWMPADSIPKGSTGDKSFTAGWEIINYSVEYVMNGGVNNPLNPIKYTIEDDTIYLQEPVKDGYTFAGWKEGSVIEHGNTGDLVFTATWKIIEYSIIYNLNGGENHPDNPLSYTAESEDITIKDPTRFGYEFSGWAPGSDVFIPSGSTNEKHLEATWTPVNYSITYDLCGDDVLNENPSTYTIEEEVIFAQPIRQGYLFVKWTNSNGETVIKIEKGSYGDILLIANWKEEVYSIEYDLGFDDKMISNPNPTQYSDGEVIELKPLELAGYIFNGWQTEKGETVTQISSLKGNIKLTANWEVIEYNINYVTDIEGVSFANNNPVKYTIEDEIILSEPTATGYEFVEWVDDFGNVVYKIEKGNIGDITLHAKWNIVEYSITYDLGIGEGFVQNNNPATYTVVSEYILLPLEMEGYIFIGWKDQDGNPVEKINSGSIGDMWLSANWEKESV